MPAVITRLNAVSVFTATSRDYTIGDDWFTCYPDELESWP